MYELLATLVVDLARRRRPDELYLLTIADPDRLGPLLADLPTSAPVSSTRPMRLQRWVGLFGTRLVLRTPDEATSVRLLGQHGAEDLDRVGQLWPWVQGHVLGRIRGFCITPLYMASLVERMRERAEAEARQRSPRPTVLDEYLEQPEAAGEAGPPRTAAGALEPEDAASEPAEPAAPADS